MFGKIVFAASACLTAALAPSAAGAFSQDEIDKAVMEFRNKCQPLGGSMWADLRDVHATVDNLPPDHYQEKGWKKSIRLSVRVADSPSIIKQQYAGQTLQFGIGGGKNPGIFTGKRAAKALCGFPGQGNGDDVFVPDPALKFLK